jgi:hypothetical protein
MDSRCDTKGTVLCYLSYLATYWIKRQALLIEMLEMASNSLRSVLCTAHNGSQHLLQSRVRLALHSTLTDSTSTVHTRHLHCPHIKKSEKFMSGEHAGHTTGPPRPIHVHENRQTIHPVTG